MDDLKQWIGRTETATDAIGAFPVAALAATLDRDDGAPQLGDELPPLWHWLYFLPIDRQSALGPDGHAARGGFLPPVELPRRMWAGSRFRFEAPLRVGDAVTRVSRIASVTEKQGRSGRLVFVTVHHEISNSAGLAIQEEHDIVYRGHETGAVLEPPAAPAASDWMRTVHPDDVLLFRYSALTANGHRIHYDLDYVTREEGYPGLIVHGPLQATWLADIVRQYRPGARIARFSYRGRRPAFHQNPITLVGWEGDQKLRLETRDHEGAVCMSAEATLG